MKYHTQGQRYQGFSTTRIGVRHAALAAVLVIGSVGVYAVTLASGATGSHATLSAGASTALVTGPTLTSRSTPRTSTHRAASPTPRRARLASVSRDASTPVAAKPRGHAVASTGVARISVARTKVTRNSVTRTRRAPVATTTAPVHALTPTSSRPSAPKPVTTATSATSSAPTMSAAASALAANLNPSANIAPSPDFLQSGQCVQNGATWSCDNPCVTSSLTWPTVTNDPGCTNYILSAINAARGVEGLAPMVLPTNWYSLTTPEQLFVVADLERTARGLAPYVGINAALSADAQQAAVAYGDPGLAKGFAVAVDPQGYPAMGGAWSAGFSVLAADYIWMYDDGWAGSANATSNIVCTSATAAGCWAHRDELLGYDPGYNPGVGLDCANAEMGVGFAVANGSGSFVDLIEQPKGTPPAMTFTWAANVVPYL